MKQHYYGIQRSSEYLAHYGVKGMKWGVRKAIEKGDSKALKRHYDKASKKLNKLRENANLPYQYKERLSNAALAGIGALGTGASALGASASSGRTKTNLIGTGALSAGVLGLGTAKTIKAHYRTGTKGHNKAVKSVNNWQNEMREAFKGTKYENNKRPYKDEYSIVDYSNYKNGSPTTITKISGSHLTRNYKGSDKKAFLDSASGDKLVVKSPRTYDRTDPWDGWETKVDWTRKKRKG